ncbi:MAG: menaquinone biosynthesis decarboxylase, partial [Bacteroidales bacterium]
MIQNFEEFLKILHQKDELLTISRFVDPNMEIAELTDRQMAQPHGGKALLFENNGTNFPVVTNIFSSEKRIALVFDMDNLDDVCTRISGFFQAFSQTLTNSRFMR